MTKNVLHKKIWRTGAVKIQLEPSLILIIKQNNDKKLETYSVKVKLRKDSTSETSNLYRFKMTMFDNGEPKELLLFERKFHAMTEALGIITANANLQYIQNLLHG